MEAIRDRLEFHHRDPGNPAEGEAFDALCRELQYLERRGWITLDLQRNYLTEYGRWFAAIPALTREGVEELLREVERHAD